MTSTDTGPNSSTLRIDKRLFEAGNQCAKRLYLEAHRENGDARNLRKELPEVAQTIVECARQGFPTGTKIGESGLEEASRATADKLAAGPAILFDAAFQSDHCVVETDIVISDGEAIDLFEIKAGTTIKQRHLFDVALQISTIESAGHTVRHATILHLDPKYEHGEGTNYPVHKLFRNVDVTDRARRLIERVDQRVEKLIGEIDNEESLDLPTGTWCRHPLPCAFFEECRADSPDNPLIDLPGLTHAQECRLHEDAIEDLDQLADDDERLTDTQRRAMRCLKSGEREVDDFVRRELTSVDFPLQFIHVQWHMEVLPIFLRQRPWQKLPFQWSARIVQEDGSVSQESFVATDATDPRQACVESLAALTERAGTVVTYQPEFDARLRALLDSNADLKPHVRTLLHVPLLDLAELVSGGVYAPEFRGRFDLPTVYEAWIGQRFAKGLEVGSRDEASDAYRRILNSRTRAATRKKLGAALTAYGDQAVEAITALYESLRGE